MFLTRAASRLAGRAMAALFLVGATLAPPAVAADFDAAKHFKGKSIRLVVDFKPGGGTDVQARYARRWRSPTCSRIPRGATSRGSRRLTG
jgi:hypothetical protein